MSESNSRNVILELDTDLVLKRCLCFNMTTTYFEWYSGFGTLLILLENDN